MHDSNDLLSAFLSSVPASSAAAETPGLEPLLRAHWQAAREEWPDIALSPHVFMEFLAIQFADGLPTIERAPDLYVACACAEGMSSAIEAFRRRYRPAVARAIARIDPSPIFLDEVMQSLGVKFFVRSGDHPPGITKYSGRSSLRGWLATSATRTALNLRRSKADQNHDEIGSCTEAIEADPELLLMKARTKSELTAAIRAAIATIPVKMRALLLLQICDGLTYPQLATMHGVSRATVARWLASTREAIVEQTRVELTRRLGLSASEYDSLVALVRSQIDVSLTTLLVS